MRLYTRLTQTHSLQNSKHNRHLAFRRHGLPIGGGRNPVGVQALYRAQGFFIAAGADAAHDAVMRGLAGAVDGE